MIIDANELSDPSALPSYDVCVVGSRPAGLTVAHELSRRRLRVCVLESGQARRTEHAESLKTAWSEGGIVLDPNSRERAPNSWRLTRAVFRAYLIDQNGLKLIW
jgi:choline dehydrogenase-like flavoprotein